MRSYCCDALSAAPDLDETVWRFHHGFFRDRTEAEERLMKVRVPVLVKDRSVAKYKDIPFSEEFTINGEDVFLDGPVSRRVAVLDFDPETGQLSPGARFVPPSSPKDFGRYECDTNRAFQDRAFCQVVAFGGVHKTLAMFEESDALAAFPARAKEC